MMAKAGNRHHYYRDEAGISERSSRPFWSMSELQANWASWEDCHKRKGTKKAELYSPGALTQYGPGFNLCY